MLYVGGHHLAGNCTNYEAYTFLKLLIFYTVKQNMCTVRTHPVKHGFLTTFSVAFLPVYGA